MKEQLISFKVAKLAKEKGFNLNSHAFYGCDEPASGAKGNQLILRDWENWTNFGDEDSQEGTLTYSAPTQTLLQKWLREIHHIVVTPTTDFVAWECKISHPDWIDENILRKDENGNWFNSYEDALEAGIFEALNLIK